MDGEAVKASLERPLKESTAIQNALKIKTSESDGYTLNISTTEPFPELVSEPSKGRHIHERFFDKRAKGKKA